MLLKTLDVKEWWRVNSHFLFYSNSTGLEFKKVGEEKGTVKQEIKMREEEEMLQREEVPLLLVEERTEVLDPLRVVTV